MRTSVLVSFILLLACNRSQPQQPNPGQAPSGLPPSTESPSPATSPVPPADPRAAMPRDDVHGGGAAADPHGMGGGMGGMGANPHGGMGAPVDGVVVEGTIDAAAARKADVKAGDVLFVTVKNLDAAGAPTGFPIGVERIEVQTLPAQFKVPLTAKPAGQVAVVARVDRDRDAGTRTAGDLEGTAKTAAPARDVKLVLDTDVK